MKSISRANTLRALRTSAFADTMFRLVCTRRRQRAPALANQPAPSGGIRITDAFKRQAAQAGVPSYLYHQVARTIATQHCGDGLFPCGPRQSLP